jgi:hypothetical protein
VDKESTILRNPYVCGGWVAGSYFYGREELTREIIDGHSPVLYIMGGRRSGKTSLLRRVEAICVGEEKACLFLDLQTTGRTLDGLFQVLRMELRGKARYWDHLLLPSLFAAADVFTLLRGLNEWAQVRGTDLLLLLDEAEVLLELADSSPQPVAQLWEVMRESPTLRLTLVASPELVGLGRLLDPQLAHPLWKGCQLRFLAGMDDGAAGALIQQSNSCPPVRVSSHLMKQIKEATGCHPYLLQLLCQRLYQADHSLRSMDEADLKPDELLGSLFSANYGYLGRNERDVLWLIADHPGKEMVELRERVELGEEILAACLGWLESLGYIRRRPSGLSDQVAQGFHIADRFLASWLSDHREELHGMPSGEPDPGQLTAMACDIWPHHAQAQMSNRVACRGGYTRIEEVPMTVDQGQPHKMDQEVSDET